MIWRNLLTCLQPYSYLWGYQRKNILFFTSSVHFKSYTYANNVLHLYFSWSWSQFFNNQNTICFFLVLVSCWGRLMKSLWFFLSLGIHFGIDNASLIIMILCAGVDLALPWTSLGWVLVKHSLTGLPRKPIPCWNAGHTLSLFLLTFFTVKITHHSWRLNNNRWEMVSTYFHRP